MTTRLLSILLPLALLDGCALPKPPTILKAPVTSILSVALSEQTDAGVRVEVVIELVNENDVPLPLITSNYRISVGSAGSFAFIDQTNCTVPAHGTQTLTLPAAFAHGGANLHGAPYDVSGAISFKPPGEVREVMTESGIPLPRSSFAGKGKLP